MRVLIILDHPRQNSLTHQVAAAFAAGLADGGHTSETLDLHAAGFDPRMTPDDEPDWNDENKRYSYVVHTEIARIKRADALAFVFPIWWWGLPAMTKGYIDRTFARGFAYGGDAKLSLRKIQWLALGAADEATFAKRGYLDAMKTQLAVGIADYCGVPDSRIEMFYASLDGEEAVRTHLERARAIGQAWPP